MSPRQMKLKKSISLLISVIEDVRSYWDVSSESRIGESEWRDDIRFYATDSAEISIAVGEVDENIGVLAISRGGICGGEAND